MKNIIKLIKNILKVTFRNKGNYIVYLILPIIGITTSIGLYAASDTKPLTLGIIDHDGDRISKDMGNAFTRAGNFKIVELDEDKLNDHLLKGSVNCVVVIPEDFAESIYSYNPKTLEIITLEGQETAIWLESFANIYIRNVYDLAKASNGDKSAFERMYEGYMAQNLKLNVGRVDDKAKNRMITVSSLGFLIMFIMLGANMTTEMVLKEKRNRTYFRICSAPVSSREYILANILAGTLIIVVQVILLIVIMRRIFHIETYIPDYQLFIILTLFGILAIGVGMLIVSFSKSSYQSGTLANLIITPTCMLGGCFWSVKFMPEVLQKASYFMPQRWVLDAVETIQKGGSIRDVAMHLGILAAFAAVFFIVAAYKFSTSDDIRTFV
ncbi:MAG TPA: ABC transporter permease [Clostridiales bacterium]|nr:ABC transporter permease [Clostridiales bacterium]